MLDYGWYTYNGTVHMLSANPDNGAFIRSGTGDSYARFPSDRHHLRGRK